MAYRAAAVLFVAYVGMSMGLAAAGVACIAVGLHLWARGAD